MEHLEQEIAHWRAFVEKGAIEDQDLEELETHLRDQITDLVSAGLADDEAFLVAVKRMGSLDELSREYAREHSGRLWRQLVLAGGDEDDGPVGTWNLAFLYAIGAAVTIEIARLLAGSPAQAPWFARNAGLLVLPFLAGYFAHRERLSGRQILVTAIPFLVAAVVVNVYPYTDGSSTELLVATHLPVLLWFVLAYPYMRGDLRSQEPRMDFVRFTGEWFIYYVLIALGGAVLMGLTVVILQPTGVDTERLIEWVLPAGAAGAVVVAAWLVEAKKRVVENMAPVLTMLFTPLFALMLVTAAVVYAFNGLGSAFDRELLGVFDTMLVVVLGLVLYGISARDPSASPGWMDRIQLVAVIGALALDLMVLGVMVARIGDQGFTPNRTAALGLNLVLLVNLAQTAWLSIRFLMGRATFNRLERWQTTYLPVFAMWATVVVVILPPVFSFT